MNQQPIPLFIRFLRLFMLVFGVGAVIAGCAILLSDGPYLIEGEPVTKSAFLRFAAPVVVSGPVALVLAVGYWKEQVWARPATVGAVLVGSVVMAFSLGSSAEPFLQLSLSAVACAYVILAFWYFYRKPSVQRYYQVLKS